MYKRIVSETFVLFEKTLNLTRSNLRLDVSEVRAGKISYLDADGFFFLNVVFADPVPDSLV